MAPFNFKLKLVVAAVAAAHAAGDAINTVPWDTTFPTATEHCVVANATNKRLVFVATPEGNPPAGGWPVYFSFVTDTYPSMTGTPCGADATTEKKAPAFSAPEDTLKYCPCIKNNTCDTARPTPPPATAAVGYKQPPPHHHHHGGGCQYDTLAGELWDMRLKQLIVANGVAIVQVNPASDDGWVAYDSDPSGGPVWSTSSDKPFLTKAFALLKSGALGPLNADRVVLRGWSGGAQMVSWMINIWMLGQLPDISIKAGMFLAGGSHDCYESTPATSHGQCAKCDPSETCPGAPWHVNAGCSTNLTHAPCCQKCCPTGFTEQYFYDHPDKYAEHPPCFLSQTSLQDENADLCAAKNYHDTLIAHGVHSELVRTTGAYERCYCIGDPRDPAAAGSPFSKYCLHDAMKWSCFTHEMGFAEMVVPSVEFLVNTFGNSTALL